MDPILGTIIMFAGNFAPRGWALCNGQILSIAQNTALFSILGTTYGGNGQTTFALPNLQGRVPIQPGQGQGLSNRVLGEMAGTETVTLLNSQMPAHNHMLAASNAAGTSDNPQGAYPALAQDAASGTAYPVYGSTADTTMNAAAITLAGNGQPHDNMQPYLCINFIIALEGIFPSRN